MFLILQKERSVLSRKNPPYQLLLRCHQTELKKSSTNFQNSRAGYFHRAFPAYEKKLRQYFPPSLIVEYQDDPENTHRAMPARQENPLNERRTVGQAKF